MYTIKAVLGKGQRLLATEEIPKGTRILSEESVITIPEGNPDEEWLETHINGQVDSLDNIKRQLFLSMHNLYRYNNVSEQYLSICRTNGLPIEAGGVGGGIFLEACRINHSCDNNSQKSWN
jgi:hypothetical protein